MPNFLQMRNKYDSSVVFLYAMGKEKFLPSEFSKTIPYTTISNWRKADYSKYAGHEFRYFFDEALQNVELKYRYRRSQAMLYGLSRAWAQVGPFVEPVFRNAGRDKMMQQRVIKAIQILQTQIGMERALKIFRLSRTRYQQWLLETRFNCHDSFLSICSKHHPHQLALKEVRKMKKMLLDPELDHWPIVSIAASALRTKDLTASLYSWYKYARLLGITKKAHKGRVKKIGLVATQPNEYFHVDTTYYPLIDEKKVCITFVMDNFSKMILGFHVAEGLSFEGVKIAFATAMAVRVATAGAHSDMRHLTE